MRVHERLIARWQLVPALHASRPLSSPKRSSMLAQASAKRISAPLLGCARNVPLGYGRGTRLLTTASPYHVTSLRCTPSSGVTVSASWYKGLSFPGRSGLCSRISPRSIPSTSGARTYATSNMSEIKIKVGDTIPQGTFTYIPWSPELEDHSACGIRT